MAGGMNRRPGAPRFVLKALADHAAALGSPTRPARPHVWVTLTDADEAPGLVLEWRREDAGWVARTLYVLADGRDITDEWLPAAALRPVVD